MYPKNVSELSPNVRARVKIERRIVRSLVREFIAGGFDLSVDDGEESHPRTTNARTLYSQLCETDEDRLFVYRVGESGLALGCILLVYGNDGYDVMSDWHTSLDPFMPQTLALVERLS